MILILGASGTAGSKVVEQLSSFTDVNIKAAAHSVEKIKNLDGNKVKTISIDYNKLQTLKEALEDVDTFLAYSRCTKCT
jgi:saccharopine dehydrogenase-like NADP-dependent oxidoreductase